MNLTYGVVSEPEHSQLVALTERLMTDVVDGNANAGVVIAELLRHPLWYPVLCHLRSRGLIGDALWHRVEDSYGRDIWRFMSDQILEMTEPGRPGDQGGMHANLSMPPHPDTSPVTTPIDALISDVVDDHPGASRVIGELARHPLWSLLLWHLGAHGVIGSALWRTIQDEYHGDIPGFVRAEIKEMISKAWDREEGIW